jgi:hypothetical protein
MAADNPMMMGAATMLVVADFDLLDLDGNYLTFGTGTDS